MTERSGARRLLVATRNAGKLRELTALFRDHGVDAIDLDAAGIPETSAEDALEVEPDFEGNALAKARYFHALSGLPTVADDSGLAVDALEGAPGVHSKRFSGVVGDKSDVDRANNEKLLRLLASHSDRGARFVCAAAFVDGHRELVTRGESGGSIVDEADGEHGFGYDPYFRSEELGKTFGAATTAEKQGISHRARAFRSLLDLLDRRAGEPGLG